MIEVDSLQERRTKVVRPTAQQPDIEETYQGSLRPTLVGITYSWTAEHLRGTEGDAHGEVEVRVDGDRQRKDGSSYHDHVILRWEKLSSWPLWVKEIVGQEAPTW